MGGLVARYWLGPCGGWPSCLALVTLGTPHRGAPKALDWLANGIPLGPRPLRGVTRRLVGERFERANETLRGWESLYELLPRYPAVRSPSPESLLYPHELRIRGFRHEQAAKAFEVHQEIEKAWACIPPPEHGGPNVVALVGHGHPTLETCVLEEGRLRVSKEPARYLWDDDWQGDATVPGRAAWPIEFDDSKREPKFVGSRHGELTATKEVVQDLRYYSGQTKVPIRGEPPGRPSVGLELEELYEAGTDVPIQVLVQNAQPGEQGAVWCTLQRAGSPQPLWRKRLDCDGDRWSLAIPGLGPGFYEIAIHPMGFTPEPKGTRDCFGMVEL
jgi:hypothetical protein